MYQNMFENLSKQKEQLESIMRTYQAPRDYIEWRVLNENEEVDNLYVQTKTLFINDNMMVLKGVDGSLEKWEIKKVYPIDKKDMKINELEDEIKKLKEMIKYEHTEPTSPIGECEQSDADANGDVESEPKSCSGSISKQEQPRTGRGNSKAL